MKPNTTAHSSFKKINRRNFLGIVSASVSAVAVACNKNESNSNSIDLGSGDTGILNYVYALEQLQAALFAQVIETPYSGLADDELSLITDIRNHENAHCEFLKAVLDLTAIPALQFNFSSINFFDRDAVLTTAKLLKDTSVSAYNGALQLISGGEHLLVTGKMASVEARHAAYLRDIISYGSFADDTIIDTDGLDIAQSPDVVLEIISPYLVSKLDASRLPTN